MQKAGDVLPDVLKDLKTSIDNAAIENKRLQEAEGTKREEKRRKRYIDLLGYRFVDATIENFEVYDPRQKPVKYACQKYTSILGVIRKEGHTLVFLGKPGTGKDHFISGISKRILEAGYKLQVQKWHHVMREIKASWNGRSDSEETIIRKYAGTDFLILTEIGIQYKTENEKILLFDILDERYRNRRPYILTSNLTLDEFRDVIDFDGYGRIWDRLNETGKIYVFDWPSYRQRQ